MHSLLQREYVASPAIAVKLLTLVMKCYRDCKQAGISKIASGQGTLPHELKKHPAVDHAPSLTVLSGSHSTTAMNTYLGKKTLHRIC